jgi:esterase/lipase
VEVLRFERSNHILLRDHDADAAARAVVEWLTRE